MLTQKTIWKIWVFIIWKHLHSWFEQNVKISKLNFGIKKKYCWFQFFDLFLSSSEQSEEQLGLW